MWMTSASELFHTRRYRFGLRHNAMDFSVYDTSFADASSSSSSSSSHQHRTTNRRHNHHHSSQNNRREYRHDDGCELASRRIHRRRLDHPEHEAVQSEQSPSGSIINSDDFRRRRATPNVGDRLPGSVLLARERLVERLRGVSVSGNRSSSSNNMLDEMESESSWQELTRDHDHHHHQHPGLGEDVLNCLELQVFNNGGESSSGLMECTICLEGFKDGDQVIRLHCSHVFHSGCLFPWVRMCGVCPNCRKVITVN